MTAARRLPEANWTEPDIAERIAALDWQGVATNLDDYGCAKGEAVLSPQECASLVETYAEEERFRSRIVMARHGFGRGEYKYFTYPLP